MRAGVTGQQIRAARGFLNWSLRDLAEAAGVGISTVQALEAREGAPEAAETGVEMTRAWRAGKLAESAEKVTSALTDAGITFERDDGRRGRGVRYREP